MNGEVDSTNAATLAARYGPHSPAAKSGHQQYFVNHPIRARLLRAEHPPAAVRRRATPPSRQLRDRPRRAGPPRRPLFSMPAHPTDHYLPPGIPGHVNGHIYPLIPDLTKARRLAKGHAGATAVLYTCNRPTCTEQAQIVKNDLAAIGLHVVVTTFEDRQLSPGRQAPGEPFDIAGDGSWAADYPDPQGVLDPLLENSSTLPPLDDPSYRAKLRAAARLSGPERYLPTPGSTGSRPQRRPPRRVRQRIQPRTVLRTDGLPDLRVLRHRPRRAVHQTRRPLSVSDEARPGRRSERRFHTRIQQRPPGACSRGISTVARQCSLTSDLH